MMNYDITQREKDRIGTEMCNLRSVSSTHSRVKSILLSLSNIVIHNQNYRDITNFTNLTTFNLYKILKACIISVNTQIMKWHNKDSQAYSKNLPPLQKLPPRARAHVGPCVYIYNQFTNISVFFCQVHVPQSWHTNIGTSSLLQVGHPTINTKLYQSMAQQRDQDKGLVSPPKLS